MMGVYSGVLKHCICSRFKKIFVYEEKNMFCTQCGTKFEDGAAFCGECGNNIMKPQQQQMQPDETKPLVQKKNKAWLPICVVLAIAVAVGVWFLFFRDAGEDDIVPTDAAAPPAATIAPSSTPAIAVSSPSSAPPPIQQAPSASNGESKPNDGFIPDYRQGYENIVGNDPNAIASGSTPASPLPLEHDYSDIADQLVWLVQPTLEYDDVQWDGLCGVLAFKNGDLDHSIVDERTGQFIRWHDIGHGGGGAAEWLYDSEKNLFGLYIHFFGASVELHPINEFSQHFPDSTNTLNLVRQVDSTAIAEIDYTYDMGAKYENSRYAVAYGTTFITEFVYDTPIFDTGRIYRNSIPVQSNNRWGFIDRNGIAIPFVFEDVVVGGSEETAFVKINDRYGIIDIGATIVAFA